jgi:glutamine synthetase
MNIRELSNNEEIITYLSSNQCEYVKVGIADTDGVLRGKYMNVQKFIKSLVDGFGFCDVIFGWDSADDIYTGWNTGYSDAKVRIVPTSGRMSPFEPNTPFFLCELEAAEMCPRGTLKRVLSRYAEKGLTAKTSLEYEFFLFKESPQTIRDKNYQNLIPFTPGMFGYSILRSTVESDLYQEILSMCSMMDFELEGLHTETGPGVIEAAISYDEALKSADKAILFKTFLKVLAQKNNLLANFMAKWSENYPGQSGHIHCSLWNNSEPLFKSNTKEEFSEDLLFFIGGLQKYMKEFCVMLAPTINSYQRFIPGAWAPNSLTWGIENRTTGFRVIPGNPESQRIENRLPGADSNPYLALAATLGAGLLGIEEKIKPSLPIKGSAYREKLDQQSLTPQNLKEAISLFKSSEAAQKLFGNIFVNHYSANREWEYKQFKKSKKPFRKEQISNWELNRYFEII